ncbi:MAG: hypothetical protein AAGJ86_09690 [Pseudomonadota bacterium]
MRLKTIILAMAAVGLASGCVTYKASIPTSNDNQPQTLQVLPALYDEEIGVQIVVSDSSNATAQYGALGALVGAIVDSAINNSRAKKAERRAEVIRELTLNYSLQDNFEAAIGVADSGQRWRIAGVSETTADTDINALVANAFDSSDVDLVVLLTGNYQMTPTVDQVTLGIRQTIYPRSLYEPGGRPKAAPTGRSFMYHSPVRPLAYREYLDGEKEQVMQDIRDEYEQSMQLEPDNADKLAKSMEKELEEIEESTQIPENIAIRETWPQVLVGGYLDQAVAHIQLMIEHDWSDPVTDEWNVDTQEAFSYVASTGIRITAKGQKIAELNEQTIYRLKHGDIVSVPTDAQ